MNIVRPSHPALDEFADDFDACLASGVLTNNGPWVQRFEAALTDYIGTPTIVFSSGQAAMMAMLAACDVYGKEVIVPSFTFCATPHAVMWAGAFPVFADIEEKTLCLSSSSVAANFSPRTQAVLGVDPYGIKWEPSIYRGGTTKVLCDSAPSFGSQSLMSGGGVDARIFSFHATKPFSTMEGGALVSSDPRLLDRARKIRNFGQDKDGDCSEPGLNGKMMEICAIIGLKQLETWQSTSMSRKVSADVLAEALEDIEGLRVIRSPVGQSPIWLYRPILIEDDFGMSRDDVVAKLAMYDINVRKYYTACHKMTCYKSNVSLPVTERIASQVISLPVFNDMKDEEISHIVESLKAIRSVA